MKSTRRKIFYVALSILIAAFLIGIIPAIICDRRTKKNGKLTFTIVRLF